MYSSKKNVFIRKKAINRMSGVGYKIFHYTLLTLLSFVLMYPLFYMISMTFRPPDQLLDPTIVWIPRSFTFENISKVWTAIKFPEALTQSVLISLGSSLIQLVACATTAYGFAKFKFKGKGVLFACVMFTIIVPPQTTIIPSFLDLKFFDFFGIGSIPALFGGEKLTINLLDTIWVYYLPAFFGNGIRAGLFILIFRQFFRGMPTDLEDAAYIDGCGFVKTFIRIIVPCAGGAFASVFLFSLIWYWNDYYYASMMIGNSPTLSLAIVALKDSFNASNSYLFNNPYEIYTLLQAACFLTVLPMLIVFVFTQRAFVESVERTGIVG